MANLRSHHLSIKNSLFPVGTDDLASGVLVLKFDAIKRRTAEVGTGYAEDSGCNELCRARFSGIDSIREVSNSTTRTAYQGYNGKAQYANMGAL